MKEEIQACFAVSSLAVYKSGRTFKRHSLNIVRGILRQQGYTFDCDTTFTKIEKGHYKTSTIYKVFRDF